MIDHSSQDHLGTKMHDLDHLIVFQCKKHRQYCYGDQIGYQIEWSGKMGFLGRKKIVKKNLSCYSLNKKQIFELKIDEIRIKPSFGIFSKMTCEDLVEKIPNLKVKMKFKMYCKNIVN
jgi:hypothetical protein